MEVVERRQIAAIVDNEASVSEEFRQLAFRKCEFEASPFTIAQVDDHFAGDLGVYDEWRGGRGELRDVLCALQSIIVQRAFKVAAQRMIEVAVKMRSRPSVAGFQSLAGKGKDEMILWSRE